MKSGGDKNAALEEEISRLKQQMRILKESASKDFLPAGEAGNLEQVMKSFFEASVTPLALLDKGYYFIHVNKAYARACRRDLSEFPGRNHFEFCPSDAKEIFDRVVQNKMPEAVSGRPFSFPDHPEWGVTYWDWKLTPLLDQQGEVEFLVFSLEDVTERKKAEIALRKSESKYHRLFEHMSSAYVLCDMICDENGNAINARLLDVNPAWEKIMGLERGKVIGKMMKEIFPWLKQDWFEVYDEITKSGIGKKIERHYKEIDKVFETFYYSPEPGIMAINFIDITERVKAEEQTRKAAEEIRDLYNNAPCGYHSLDKDGRFIRINDTELSWLGYSREEIIGKMTLREVLAPESLLVYLETFPRFKKEGYVRDLELDWIRKDGSVLPVLINASVIYDKEGNYDKSRSTVFDNTEIKRAQEILRESEKKFRIAFEHASIGRSLTAPDGRMMMINKPLCDMVGYDKEELTSENFSKITHPDDIDKSMNAIRRLMAGEEDTCQFEKRYIHKDGHIVYVSVNTILLRDAEDNPLYLISDIVDITDWQTTKDKVNRLNRVYSVLSGINEAIIRLRDINKLYEEACRIAVEKGRLRMAWIGLVNDLKGPVYPVASAGTVDGYLDSIKISSNGSSFGKGPTGTCIRENRHITCDDFETDPNMTPWRNAASKRGYRSSIAIPLHEGQEIIGAFTMYSGEPGFFKDEEVKLLLSLADDISFAIEFIEQEKLRKQAEEERDRLFNYSIDMLFAGGFDGYYKQLNPAWSKTLGWTNEELLSRPWIDFVYPEDVENTIGFFDILKKGQAVSSFENRVMCKDGSVRWISWNSFPLFDEGIIFGVARDITENKNAEERLRLAAEYNRSLIEASLDPLVTIGPDGKITDANAAAEEVTGYLRDDLIGTDFSDYFTDPEKARSGYKQVFQNGTVRDYSLEIKNREGHTTPVLYNASLYKDSSGKIIGIIAAARDITERLKAEQAVHDLNAELEQRVIERTAKLKAANEQLEAFTYSVSHDLKAPLRAINGFSGIFLEEYSDILDDEGKRYLEIIRRNTKDMGNLIEGLLDLSRVGRAVLKPAVINMEDMARRVFEELSLSVEDRIISFDVKPAPACNADKMLIHQVLQNLIANAIKFTKPKADARIEFGGRDDENRIIYYIKDNGVGFDMRYLDKLFGVFRRLHSSEDYEGTGIGLALVKRIIDLHGGRVWAEGAINEGAVFYFALPK